MPAPGLLGRFRELVAGEGRGSVNVNPVTAMVVGWCLIPVTVVGADGVVRRYGPDVPVGVLVVEEEGRFLAAVRAAGERAVEYDEIIGGKLKQIIARSSSYEDALQRERAEFVDLCGRALTHARIKHMLDTGKPLRN